MVSIEMDKWAPSWFLNSKNLSTLTLLGFPTASGPPIDNQEVVVRKPKMDKVLGFLLL